MRAPRVALAVALCAALSGARAGAAARSTRPFILDRGFVEWVLGFGGWRSGISPDQVNPGFSVFGGGSDLNLGLDLRPGVGLFASGRVLAGPRLAGVYVEGMAGLGVQLRVNDWVRLRAGIASGQARLDRSTQPTDTAILLGGFVVASVDLVRFGRASACGMLRFDVDGHLVAGATFARESIALSAGAGFRF